MTLTEWLFLLSAATLAGAAGNHAVHRFRTWKARRDWNKRWDQV